jgi:hypothetical protein
MLGIVPYVYIGLDGMKVLHLKIELCVNTFKEVGDDFLHINTVRGSVFRIEIGSINFSTTTLYQSFEVQKTGT